MPFFAAAIIQGHAFVRCSPVAADSRMKRMTLVAALTLRRLCFEQSAFLGMIRNLNLYD